VLEVAERLFLEKGFHQVSLALVASSAAVATRTIYARFGDKRALLEEIIEAHHEASEMALDGLAGRHLPSTETLRRLAAHAFEHDLSPPLELLHADLLADRDAAALTSHRWMEAGAWRSLLEQALEPAPGCVADIFVACLMKVRQRAPRPRHAEKWLPPATAEMAQAVLACFLEQIRTLNVVVARPAAQRPAHVEAA
jgi:AcrR family transcriptional regulator